MGTIGAPLNALFVNKPEDFGEVIAQKGILVLVRIDGATYMLLAKHGVSYTILNPVFTGNYGKINSIGEIVTEAGLATIEDLEEIAEEEQETYYSQESDTATIELLKGVI